MTSEKLNIAVLFGGVTSEYKISCLSAANVISILDTEKYSIYVIGITNKGKWFLTDATTDEIRNDKWLDAHNREAVISPDRSTHGILLSGGKKIKIDVAFPVMHGKNGEDGAIAALFQLAGIPQVTTTMTSGANSMDKVITKILCERAGIPQADWEMFYDYDIKKDINSAVKKIESRFEYPVFVKPSSAGSSVGVNKCRNRLELENGLKEAALHDFKVLVEECITGVEIETAVIGNTDPEVSVCGQIAPSEEFYSYDSKYNDENSRVFIPAKINETVQEKVREYALAVYKAMECQGMSRIDFFVTADGGIVFNELNTIPGFTDISMYPKLMEYSGFQGKALVDYLIQLALAEDRR